MMKKFTFIFSLILPICCLAQKFPYQNSKLSSEARAKDLVCRLTLEEKALLMDGVEVVQVYVHKTNDNDGPSKTLRGFQRVNIATGKTKQVVANLPNTAFEFFDAASGKMQVTPGEYELWYGNSSNTKDLKMTKITIL